MLASRLTHSVAKKAVRSVRNYTAPLRDIKFVLNEVFDYPSHYANNLKSTGGEEATPDMVDMVLEETAKFAQEMLAPLAKSGDEVGCKYVDQHTVITPPGYKEAYDQFTEGGWQGLSYPAEFGGQGMPTSMSLIQSDITGSACFAWTMYPGLSKGAINTILLHGNDALKEKYLSRMVSGEFTGTMCLTEPQCGSDLGQVTTKAEPNGDGTYKISGTKIFISCGEHDLTENIVHCVLARLPGAPAGTKGISLFAVPKKLVSDEDGSIGAMNGCNIGRIENKMGVHGSSTCEINFENAVGVLIGTENKGMNHMFTFINTSRLGTAVQGMAAAELSYQHSLPYAKERGSMRALSGTKDKDKPNDAIINHPGVRKLLFQQKAIAEGGRSMVYECAQLADKMREAEVNGDLKAAAMYDDQLGFLTPILKGFLTEKGLQAANAGVQVWGGHGFIKDNFQEQIVRDVRIASLWEGTTQIQGLDLLGRKILFNKLKPLNEHVGRMRSKVWDVITSTDGSTRSRALEIYMELFKWQYYTMKVAKNAMSDRESVGVAATDYLMYAGYVQLTIHWLMMEAAAKKALAAGPGKMREDKAFYEAKIAMSEYVHAEMFSQTRSLAKTMFSPTSSIMQMPIESFSFDYAQK